MQEGTPPLHEKHEIPMTWHKAVIDSSLQSISSIQFLGWTTAIDPSPASQSIVVPAVSQKTLILILNRRGPFATATLGRVTSVSFSSSKPASISPMQLPKSRLPSCSFIRSGGHLSLIIPKQSGLPPKSLSARSFQWDRPVGYADRG